MSAPKRLLLIEDDAHLAALLADLLQSSGYRVSVAHTAQKGLEEFQSRPPDLVLLDLALPDMSGFAVLRHIRARSNVPIVIVSGDATEADKVQALENGADDYITKPFHEDELLARITALLRRISWTPQSEAILEVGHLRVDMARRQVTMRGEPLHLTPIEYAILCTLMQHAGRTVTHEELLTGVWGPEYRGDFSVLRVNISRLRHKVEADPRQPQYILTVPRQGYRMPVSAGHGAH